MAETIDRTLPLIIQFLCGLLGMFALGRVSLHLLIERMPSDLPTVEVLSSLSRLVGFTHLPVRPRGRSLSVPIAVRAWSPTTFTVRRY